MMKTLVIKVGGALLEDDALALGLLGAIKILQATCHVVLVHGGGNGASNLLKQLGLKSEKIDGLRITPPEQIDYVVGALAGSANKTLCALATRAGLNPVGLSLFDGKSIQSQQLDPQLGCVGSGIPNNPTLLKLLIKNGFFPVINSIGSDHNGNLLNVNADQAATAVASLLDADLYFLSDVPGVLDANKTRLSELSAAQARAYMDQGVITDGMIVKVKAAQQAASALGKAVTIASWQKPEDLLNIQRQPIGTQILPLLVEEQA